jgi:hypothetical protein
VIQWNEVGPPGPAGAEGPAGPAGPAGPEGPPIATGFYLNSNTVAVAPGSVFVNNVFCEEGDLPISGGYFIYVGSTPQPGVDPGSSNIFVNRYLVPSATTHGWVVRGSNTSDGTQNVIVRVLCAETSVPLPEIG